MGQPDVLVSNQAVPCNLGQFFRLRSNSTAAWSEKGGVPGVSFYSSGYHIEWVFRVDSCQPPGNLIVA